MKEQTLEHRIFRTALPVVMFMVGYALTYRLFFQEYLVAGMYGIGFGVTFFIWHRSRNAEFFEMIIVPWIAFMAMFAVFFWFKAGGYRRGGLIFFTVIVFSTLLAPAKKRALIVSILILVQIALLLLDVFFQDLMIWGDNPKAPWDFILLTLVNVFLVWMLKKNYDSKQLKINKFSIGLRELHRLNLRHNSNLGEILDDYLQSGATLLRMDLGVIISVEDQGCEIQNYNNIKDIGSGQKNYTPNRKLVDLIESHGGTCYRFGAKTNVDDLKLTDTMPSFFIGAPLTAQEASYGVLLFSTEKSSRKRFEEYEIEIIELMALNISHLLDMKFWKKNQVLADQALILSEKRFKSIYDHANVGICVCDMEGKIVMANRGLQEIYGYSEEEILNKTFYSFAFSGDVSAMEQDLFKYEKIILGEIENYSIDKKKLTKSGGLIDVTKTVSVIKDENGEVQYTVMITDDITRRKKNEEKINNLNTELAVQVGKLEAVNNELETFSYSISHDLRAPLRAIDGFSKIILEDQADQFNDESKRLLNVIIKNSGKMAMLIDDLLTFSRLSRQSDKFVPINFDNLVNDIIEEQALDRSILELSSLPIVKGEKTMMKQVLSNLIGNAIKFSSKVEAPSIRIGCQERDDSFEFFVKDNGVGFNMAYYNKVFGVFHRLHTDDEFKGTGVGLAIVKKVMDKHKGEVWADSQEGKGASFYFKLPK